MALTIEKSMNVSDFWRCWEHIVALVEEEYRAVEGEEGYYKLSLELIWDCDEDEVECNDNASKA